MKLIVLFILLGGCTKKLPPELQISYDKGKSLYVKNCITCHNPNPKRPGPSGPPIYNSSYDLLYNKVLFGRYPEGYKPKMPSKLMRGFEKELNKTDIEALRTFLQN